MTSLENHRTPSLRSTLVALIVAALVYVAILGVFIVVRMQPATEQLRARSQVMLAEYQESTRRVERLDATLTDLWSLLGAARREPLSPDTLARHRLVVQALAESTGTLLRIGTGAGSDTTLRRILGNAVENEEQLRGVVLGAIGSLELSEIDAAERLLRRADSLDTPLNAALTAATTVAIRRVVEYENELARTVDTMNTVAWAWLIGGLLTLPLLAGFLRRRLAVPLARLDAALDRIDEGDLEVHLPVLQPDEIGRLVEHFNRTTALLRRRALEDEQRAEDRSIARTRAVLEAALDAVIVADVEGRIKEWSPQAVKVFGWQREEVLDRQLADTIIPVQFRRAYRAGLARFAQTGEPHILNQRLELVALRRDGTQFPVEVTISPLVKGEQVEFSAFIRDITERHEAEAALAESEARYRTAFEEASVGMVEIALDGRYLRVNRAFGSMIGRAPEDLVGVPYVDVTHPDDRPGDRAVFGELVAGRSTISREKRYLRPDGQVVNARIHSALVRDGSGAPLYVLTVVQDVTAQRLLEEQLRQTHKMDAVGQLAGGVAHDFNNLLTAIIGYADLLRRTDSLPAEVREDATAILATAERGADLARNLLTLSRAAPARQEGVDLHEVIAEVRDIATRTFDRRISVRASLRSSAPVVIGDRSLLVHALLNLTLNARDAMPDGGQLTIGSRDCQLSADECEQHAGIIAPGRYIAVTVADTGVGMPTQVRERIFEPFFTTKPAGKGTGIGLAMVYGTVRSHHGVIEVESTEGEGAQFTVYLPMRTSEASRRDPMKPDIQRGTGRILLADDEDMVRDVAARMLRRLGYDVELALDGVEAVAKATEAPGHYDLVILDGNMPRMTGREAAVLIAKATPGVPLLLATGYLEPGEAENLSRCGFAAAIAKPYNLSELSRIVAAQLNGEKGSRVKGQG
jgi:PAS domain S-box-containing protein